MDMVKDFRNYLVFLEKTYWNNTVKDYLVALGVAALVMIFLRVVKWMVMRYFANRPQSEKWDVVELTTIVARRTQLTFIMIFAIYAGLQVLTLPARLLPWIFSIAMAALILQVTLWANALVDYFLSRSQQRNAARITTLRAAGFIVKLVLAVIAAVVILDNIPGVEITALIASLGITGIAVALAVQNILSDLFASLSIVLDKPFVLGDFIIVDTHMGTVENIGLKTTRLRSLSGEQLVFSNNDLLKSRVRNFKRMAERRVVFSLGVTYQTRPHKLKQVPATIRQIIESQQMTRFDRAHFQGFADSALTVEVVYYVLDPDYNRYMDIQQAINLAILQTFADEGIEFAYPTRTLYFDGNMRQDSRQAQAAVVN